MTFHRRNLIQKAGSNADLKLIAEIWENNLPEYMSTIIHSNPILSLDAIAVKLDMIHKAVARKATTLHEPAAAAIVNNIAVVDLTERLTRVEQLLTEGAIYVAERPHQSRQQPHQHPQQYAQSQQFAQPQQQHLKSRAQPQQLAPPQQYAHLTRSNNSMRSLDSSIISNTHRLSGRIHTVALESTILAIIVVGMEST